jgi:DNA polymerase (family 10)
MNKDQVAEILNSIGVLLEIKGENPFKTKAYFNGARALESTTEDLGVLVKEERLGEIKGIGSALQDKITKLVTTGSLPYYDELKASLPPGLIEMLSIQGVGPKKVKVFYETLKIETIDELEAACKDGRVAALPKMGEKTAANILESIIQHRSYQDRHRYGDVIEKAEEIIDTLRSHPDVIRISLGGSIRRGKEVIKDVDILISSSNPKPVMEAFIKLPGIIRVTGNGETKSSVIFEGGLACDLRVVEDKVFPYALHHFTGSKEHNVAMRQRAIEQNKKMSEWGLFDTSTGEEVLIPCVDETELFKKLGLSFIPPELRENLGEIEAAEKNQIPKLIEWTDLKGTFHNHTIASDGHNTLEEMAIAADELGLDYLGIADHSKSQFQANGMSEEKMLQQIEEIKKINVAKKGAHLFAGVEVDILKDGTLDFSDDILKQLDYVVASVHGSFQLSEEEQTKRIIKAVENPYVTMLGHLTGRLLLKREAYEVDIRKVIDACAANGTWIELNANPYRLDMDWRWWKLARDKGVKCVINPDAHATDQLAFLKIGVNIARKGWLRKEDVLNTLSLSEIKKKILLNN